MLLSHTTPLPPRNPKPQSTLFEVITTDFDSTIPSSDSSQITIREAMESAASFSPFVVPFLLVLFFVDPNATIMKEFGRIGRKFLAHKNQFPRKTELEIIVAEILECHIMIPIGATQVALLHADLAGADKLLDVDVDVEIYIAREHLSISQSVITFIIRIRGIAPSIKFDGFGGIFIRIVKMFGVVSGVQSPCGVE